MAGASIVAHRHPARLLQPYDQSAQVGGIAPSSLDRFAKSGCPQPTYRHGVCFLDRGVVMSTAGSTMTVIGEGGRPQRRWVQ